MPLWVCVNDQVNKSKFGPNWAIGIPKQKFLKSLVQSFSNETRYWWKSPVIILNVAEGDGNGAIFILTYDWVSMFKKIEFHKISMIREYYYFEFNSDYLGIVIDILTCLSIICNLCIISVLQPNWISVERAKYLYQKIRHVSNIQ